MGWGDYVEFERRLEVGLFEHRIHAPGVGNLELGVQVDLPVHRVNEPVQTFPSGHVRALGDDFHDIAGFELIEMNPTVDEHLGRIKVNVVESH